MHLTLVSAICSIGSWKIIQGQFLNLSSVLRQKMPAGNICFNYVGRMGFIALDAEIRKFG